LIRENEYFRNCDIKDFEEFNKNQISVLKLSIKHKYDCVIKNKIIDNTKNNYNLDKGSMYYTSYNLEELESKCIISYLSNPTNIKKLENEYLYLEHNLISSCDIQKKIEI